MTIHHAITMSGLALALSALGCSGPAADPKSNQSNVENQTSVLVDDTDAVVKKPGGLYLGALSEFEWLSLADDGSNTYWWSNDVDESDGTYSLKKLGDQRVLMLDEHSDQSYVQLYVYSLPDDSSLALTELDATSLMVRGGVATMKHTGLFGEPCSLADDGQSLSCAVGLVCNNPDANIDTSTCQIADPTPPVGPDSSQQN